MLSNPDNDFLRAYETALEDVSGEPQNRAAQHRAVLALARLGALDFALFEYERYGLSEVRHHEDIMALAGRLFKDLYMLSAGKTALEHARNSAQKYEAAFQDTQGYYSGINAATMALLADMPEDMVADRVAHIWKLLPSAEKVTPSDHYFVEATRAECFLLKSDVDNAKKSLRSAITFDPLNYAAHASTLKQFRLILDKREDSQTWLSAFLPPRSMHYAGHIWDANHMNEGKFTALPQTISDKIQIQDIGFGYGALAAGADIIIAEALLEEGANLHVVLPCDVEHFRKYSVMPFGRGWGLRFESCLERATSVTCLELGGNDTIEALNVLSARVAMGQAVLNGSYYDTQPCQLLIHDVGRSESFTALHAKDWREAGREQIVIPLELEREEKRSQGEVHSETAVVLARSDSHVVEEYADPISAVVDAVDILSKFENMSIGLHMKFGNGEAHVEAIANRALPNEVFVSEAFASYLTLLGDARFKVRYAGVFDGEDKKQYRMYKLQVVDEG